MAELAEEPFEVDDGNSKLPKHPKGRMEILDELLTLEEAADLLRITVPQLKHQHRHSGFPIVKINGIWRVRKSVVAAYVNGDVE